MYLAQLFLWKNRYFYCAKGKQFWQIFIHFWRQKRDSVDKGFLSKKSNCSGTRKPFNIGNWSVKWCRLSYRFKVWRNIKLFSLQLILISYPGVIKREIRNDMPRKLLYTRWKINFYLKYTEPLTESKD